MFSLVVRLIAPVFLAAVLACHHAGAADTSSTGKHFLWQVTNAPATFYLLGSLNAMHGSDYPLGSTIDNAIGQCQRFVFEFDFLHTAEAGYSRLVRDAAQYPRGTLLKQKVRPETYAFVQKIAKIRASEYDHLKPWAIAYYMVGNTGFTGVYGYYGVAGYVLRKSGTHNVWGLETCAEHIRVLSGMTDEESEVYLLQTLVHTDADVKQFPELVTAWKSGNAERFYAISAAHDGESPSITWRFVDRRNRLWIPKVETAIKDGKPTMVVLSARHLCGPHNVIDLLRGRGYKIEQL
jgi:uncharacterized protein YbaP (TraB family)